MRSDEQNELDHLIDSALRGYSAADPSPGMDQRVLNRIRTVARPWSWRWALAIPVLASLVFAVIVIRNVRSPAAEPLTLSQIRTAPPQAPAVQAAPPPRVVRPKPLRTTHDPAMTKHQQFPAPTPITPEEQALLAFATRHPAEAQETLVDWRKRMDEPIEIKEIQIQPLQSDGAQ
jgi:hypothetical protein